MMTNKPRYTMGHFGENQQMGGFLDDLWSSAVTAGDKAVDKLITDQQKQLTNTVTKTLYNLVGLDGKTVQVSADSPEYKAYVASMNAQPPVAAPSIFEQYQKQIMLGAIAVGGLLVVSILWKMFRPAPAPMIIRANPTKASKKAKKKTVGQRAKANTWLTGTVGGIDGRRSHVFMDEKIEGANEAFYFIPEEFDGLNLKVGTRVRFKYNNNSLRNIYKMETISKKKS